MGFLVFVRLVDDGQSHFCDLRVDDWLVFGAEIDKKRLGQALKCRSFFRGDC